MNATIEQRPIVEEQPPKTFQFGKSFYEQMVEMGWFDGKRVELIEGEIIEMSPIGKSHWVAVNRAAQALITIFPISQYIVSVQASLNAGSRTQPEPDIAVFPGQISEYEDSDEIPGNAILVVEIAESSLAYDRNTKAGIYAKAGFQDYWIIDLAGQRVEVYRGPTESPAAPFGHIYGSRTIYKRGQSIKPVASSATVNVNDLLPSVTPAA